MKVIFREDHIGGRAPSAHCLALVLDRVVDTFLPRQQRLLAVISLISIPSADPSRTRFAVPAAPYRSDAPNRSAGCGHIRYG
jgi:hypothetical protein